MLKHLTRAIVAALLALLGAPPAFAQRGIPANARPIGEAKRELRVSTRDDVPQGYEDVARGPESKTRRLGDRTWLDQTAYTDDQLEAEAAYLKQERTVRIRAITSFEQEIREVEARTRRKPSEKMIDELEYRRALYRYRIVEEHRQTRQINQRLAVLSRERARRTAGPGDTPESEARDLTNVQQARAAIDLLADYDRAVAEVLRRDPVTEEDVVYALGLLNEKARVADVVTDYFRLLEEEAAARGARTQPTTPAPASAGGP